MPTKNFQTDGNIQLIEMGNEYRREKGYLSTKMLPLNLIKKFKKGAEYDNNYF